MGGVPLPPVSKGVRNFGACSTVDSPTPQPPPPKGSGELALAARPLRRSDLVVCWLGLIVPLKRNCLFILRWNWPARFTHDGLTRTWAGTTWSGSVGVFAPLLCGEALHSNGGVRPSHSPLPTDHSPFPLSCPPCPILFLLVPKSSCTACHWRSWLALSMLWRGAAAPSRFPRCFLWASVRRRRSRPTSCWLFLDRQRHRTVLAQGACRPGAWCCG